MLPDAQEVVCKEIFRGALPCEVEEFWQTDMEQDCVFHIFDRSPEMVKAALVCKSWNQAYRDYLKVFFAEQDAKIQQTAVSNGLVMCGLTRYEVDHVLAVPQYTQELHIVQFWKGQSDVNVLDLMLTRWKPDDSDVHTLVVEYGARGLDACPYNGQPGFYVDTATRLTQIPEVCFEDPAELLLAQRCELEKWKQDFSEQTALWLPTQRDAEDQVDAIEVWNKAYAAWHPAWLKARSM